MDVGDVVGARYRLTAEVAGSDAPLWRAADDLSGREVALLAAGSTAGAEDRARLVDAAGRALQVGHPGLRPLLDVVADEPRAVWFVYAWAPTIRTLRHAHEQDGPGDERRLLRAGAVVADGLAAVAQAGLASGPVTPGTIAVAADGSASLLGVSSGAPDEAGPPVASLVATLRGVVPDDPDGPGPTASLLDRLAAQDELAAPDLAEQLRAAAARPRASGAPGGDDEAAGGADEPGPRSPGAAANDAPTVRAQPAAGESSTPTVRAATAAPGAAARPGAPVPAPPTAQALTPPGAPGPIPPGAPALTPPGAPAAIPPGAPAPIPPTARPARFPPAGGPGPGAPHAGSPPRPAAGAGPSGPAWPPPGGRPPPPGSVPPAPPPPGPTAGRRSRVGLLVAAGVVVLALLVGAAVVVGRSVASRVTAATPSTSAAPSATPTAATGPLGDLRTADPCGLVNESALAAFGNTEVVPDYYLPASCAVYVTGTGPGRVIVSTTLAAPDGYPDGGVPQRVGAFVVSREPAETDECERVITLPDGNQVRVTADSYQGATGDLCAAAEAGTSSALSVLSTDRVPRRTTVDPPTALTTVDMCGLVDPATLARVPGLDARRQFPGYARWGCAWGYDPSFPYAPTVRLGVNHGGTFDVAPEQIGGRSVVVTPGSTSSPTTCTADVVHRPYTATNGSRRVETLEVRVYPGGSGTVDAACTAARALAAAAIPRLPPAS